ncbi:MAG: EAL domain-containing protein [Pseudomonadota bacterium]
MSDSAEHQAHIVTSATLIETLERTALHTSDDSGRAFPGICGWIVLDEVTTLRRQLGYSGLNALMDAIHQRIAENLRPGDLTARFGVDAIGLVLEPLDGERDFKQEENHIVRQISSELFEINNTSVAATVSMALRQIDETLRPAEKHLIATAEAAESLRAKGGNRAQLMTTANTSSGQSNASLLSQLTRALRDNSLKVLYQPLLSTAACSRERFQLLPRLIGSDGKMIPAARFIPIAASRGLVPAIDSWMIRQAIDLLKTHQENASESPIFFLNQSAGLIDDEKLLKWLVQEINAIDEDKRALVLEFNIDDLKSRIRSAQVVLEKIQQLGMQVSITGIDELISEPIILEHLPADYLRMKADFARRMLLSQQLGDRFSEFAGTVHSAGRKLIIPMLEDAESVARIWQMEVDLIQGNFIQQPSEMPNG